MRVCVLCLLPERKREREREREREKEKEKEKEREREKEKDDVVVEGLPEAFLGQSQEKRYEIDIAVVAEALLEIGPVPGVILADVDGARRIGGRRVREGIASFGRAALARPHNSPIGPYRCCCRHSHRHWKLASAARLLNSSWYVSR